MSGQSYPKHDGHPFCEGCQTSMSEVHPSRVMPGLGYFGHRLFECERCGKAKVIPAPSNGEIALCPTIILT
jgi:hypothetical protein